LHDGDLVVVYCFPARETVNKSAGKAAIMSGFSGGSGKLVSAAAGFIQEFFSSGKAGRFCHAQMKGI